MQHLGSYAYAMSQFVYVYVSGVCFWYMYVCASVFMYMWRSTEEHHRFHFPVAVYTVFLRQCLLLAWSLLIGLE